MLPFNWWGFTPRDATGKLIRNWPQRATVTGAAASLSASWTVLQDHAAIILAYAGEGSCAGGRIQSIAMTLQEPGTSVAISYPKYPGAFNLTAGDLWGETMSGTWIAGPGCVITIAAAFNVAAGNLLLASLNAILVPRGEVSYL